MNSIVVHEIRQASHTVSRSASIQHDDRFRKQALDGLKQDKEVVGLQGYVTSSSAMVVAAAGIVTHSSLEGTWYWYTIRPIECENILSKIAVDILYLIRRSSCSVFAVPVFPWLLALT